MKRYEVGDRVGAIIRADGDTIEIYGYGIYEGKKVPPEELNVQFFGMPLTMENPCIKLDSGKLVFGCECWWGSEDMIKERVAKYANVVELDVEEVRARYNRGEQEISDASE